MLTSLIGSLRNEREELERRQTLGFSIGLAARWIWAGVKWVTLFFVIGAFWLTYLMFNMAIGGKGWR